MYTQICVNIEDVLLDPNNPRCVIDLEIKERVKDSEAKEKQEKILKAFDETGKSEFFDIKSLLDSFRAVGYVPIDKIVVKRIDKNQFIVLEGNRRVSALKVLKRRHELGKETLSQELLDAMESLPAMELHTEGVSEGELNHTISVLLGIRHHGSLLKWDPLPAAFNIYQTYMGVEPALNQFEKEQSRIKAVANTLSIKQSKVVKDLKTYISFIQLRDAVEGVKDRHFSLVQAAVTNPKLNHTKFIEMDDKSYELNDETIHRVEKTCQFDIRDNLPPEQKIIRDPKGINVLGRLVEKSKIAEHDQTRLLAEKGVQEALSGTVDPETQQLKATVQSALDTVIDRETRTQWLDTLSKLLDAQKELNPSDFRKEGNDLMEFEQLNNEIVPLKLILGL